MYYDTIQQTNASQYAQTTVHTLANARIWTYFLDEYKSFPMMRPPVGKSGPGTNFIN